MDTTPPIINFCPESETYEVPSGATSRRVTWPEVTATDDSGSPPEIFRTHRSGDEFEIGATDVQYVVVDQAGNRASCSFTITGTAVHDGYLDGLHVLFNLIHPIVFHPVFFFLEIISK